jgi:hypothetical protein
MTKLSIFEPAMCCETGVCGVDADTVLINFTADTQWLRSQGVEVQRFNLAQEPSAFISDPKVKAEINEHGETCLPLLLLDGAVVSRGNYPDRAQLQALAGFEPGSPAAESAAIDNNPAQDNNKMDCGCAPGSSC